MKMVILHGLGQSVSDWETIKNKIDYQTLTLDLFEKVNPTSIVTVDNLEKDISNYLKQIEEPFILLGLSLGGFLTLDYVVNNSNEYLKGIIVCGAIYKSIPKILNRIQRMAIKFQSDKNFQEIGLNKKQMLELITSINQKDLTNQLRVIKVPTLVVCGSKDKINLKSSKKIHGLVPKSILEIIENGQHELNKSNPTDLSILIKEFVEKTSE